MHEEQGSWTSLGLLLVRVVAGGMMLVGHGWSKLADFSDLAQRFPDPLGLGSSGIHADDPWAKKELALAYATTFLALIFTGAGKFSVDATSRFRWSR